MKSAVEVMQKGAYDCLSRWTGAENRHRPCTKSSTAREVNAPYARVTRGAAGGFRSGSPSVSKENGARGTRLAKEERQTDASSGVDHRRERDGQRSPANERRSLAVPRARRPDGNGTELRARTRRICLNSNYLG